MEKETWETICNGKNITSPDRATIPTHPDAQKSRLKGGENMKQIDQEILSDLNTKRLRLFEIRKKGNRPLDRRHTQLTEKIDEMTRKRMKGRGKLGK